MRLCHVKTVSRYATNIVSTNISDTVRCRSIQSAMIESDMRNCIWSDADLSLETLKVYFDANGKNK